VIPSGLSTKKAFLLFSTVGQKGLKSACSTDQSDEERRTIQIPIFVCCHSKP
jgi:hypothetical protein